MKQFNILRACAKENNIELSDEMAKKFEAFETLLIDRNKVMNLTAITDEKEVEIKHMVDSIAAAPLIMGKALKIKESCPCGDAKKETTRCRILDIGTGAGFPGIPLKIVLPEFDFLLADSLSKRINFIDEVIKKLGLKDIKAIAGRAEDLAKKGEPLRESFDLCVSRAVADMSVLAEYALPFVKQGGSAIFYKAGDCEEEVQKAKKAVAELGGEIEEIIEYELPLEAGKRSLVLISKKNTTPDKYPRRAGKPSKSPIN